MEEIAKEMEKVGLKNNNHDYMMIKEDELEGGNQGQKNNGGRKVINDQQKTTLRTPADIYEHPSFYSFIVDMPGLDAQNIKKKKKQIIGEPTTTTTTGNEGVKAIRLERRRARYMRKFNLAADANHEDVKAAYKEGVLSITVAKNNKKMTSIVDVDVDVEESNLNSLTNVSIT
ncbi:17.6 kDa class II heat shock protein [Bienertia sinuspersici]